MNSLYMQQHEWILWRQYWVKKASNNAISVFHFYKVQKYAEIYININTKCRVIATSGGRHGDGRGSIEVDVPPRALAETDKFSCSPHSLEGEISLVCFSFRLPHSVLCGGSQFNSPCYAVSWAYLLSCLSHCILNPLLLRLAFITVIGSAPSPVTLWFSAPFDLFPRNCPYFLLSSDMLFKGCL